MNREVALEFLKRYKAIHPKLVYFSSGWHNLFGSVEAIDHYLKLEDMFMSAMEEALDLPQEMLWNYFSSIEDGTDYYLFDGRERVLVKSLEHLFEISDAYDEYEKKESGGS